MNLKEYIKYLISIILVNLHIVFGQVPFSNNDETEHGLKYSRGVLDFVIGRLRPCGKCMCGRANHIGRVIGGEFTDTHEFPWLVNIYTDSKNIITGALINDRYVLTSASPITNSTAGDIKVAIGQYDRCHTDISSANSSVENIILHPGLDLTSKARDLALLRLSRPIKFEKRISPVCLPNPGSTYLGQVGTIVSWGETEAEDSDKKSCRPKKVGLPILGKNECFKSGIDPTMFHEDSGCVGIVGGKSFVCPDDVGAGVFYRSYTSVYDIVGIITDSNECNDDPSAAIYTKVGPHLDWILQQTKDACYCTK